jgi:serine/threonine protein kinase/Flp pilus assembly protein TadD
MSGAWARGEQITAEDLLKRHPELKTEDAIRLVYEEVCLRREAGQDVPTAEVVGRFPQWKNELEVLLGCDRLLRPLSHIADLPEVGEQLGPFLLLSELGRGASGKTYLAADPSLANRLVVLKVIPDDQDEHLSLARLLHTHIIPLFSEHTFAERGLRALCMPYLGGASLARVLEALAEVSPHVRHGSHLLEILDQIQAVRPVKPTSDDGPYRRYLEQASYVQAICWVAACLADALHEAHVHGLVHMDVKPSNVLIAGDGLPLLLDFHLARKPIKAGEQITDRLGGTRGWMAPEQEYAVKAVSLGEPVSSSVDQRADIYSLGLLLCESLGGKGAASEARAGKNWHQRNPEISTGLADITQKCLAGKPSERYRNAAGLADDLRRHLNDLPLRGVANRSLTERWQKWRRRQPGILMRSTAWSTALAAAVVAISLGFMFYRQRVREIKIDLEDGQKFRSERQFPEAARVLRRGLDKTRAIPTVSRLREQLQAELRLARRGQKAVELHHLADLIRFRYGILAPAGEEATHLLRDIKAIWQERELLLKAEQGMLDPGTEESIKRDLLELAIVWADLRVRLASTKGDTAEAKLEACQVLDEAERSCGPSPALTRERRVYAEAAGDRGRSQKPEVIAASAWEHYELGRSYLRSGLTQKAAMEFQKTLDKRPQDFWPNFYQGLCSYQSVQFADAVAAFRTCIALRPNSAECYYNRARANDSLGRMRQAYSDYSRALELDPGLAVAALNRGILSYNVNRYDDALSDFNHALRAEPSSETTGCIHYHLALALRARGEHEAALASAETALAKGYMEARKLRDSLRRGQ